MRNSTYTKWIKLHSDPTLRSTLPMEIFESWERSYFNNIDKETSCPLTSQNSDFNKNKEDWKFLYYYANDALSTFSKKYSYLNFGIALFHKDGCLVKLYGDKEFLQWAKNNKIQKTSLWDENIIGANAVSTGLRHKKSISYVGEEHFSKFATNIAMYFSPIIFENESKDNSEYGGIAIISSIENSNPCFIAIADAVSRAIALHFFWFESINLFINSGDGYIVVDQSNNRQKIILISPQVFKHLDVQFKDMHYKTLEELVDPFPSNKEFWNIIKNKTNVEDTDIKLSIKSNSVKVNISVRPFYGVNFHIEGVSIIFNSRERIQNIISRHTGNNATFTFAEIIGKNEKYINVLNQAKAAAQSNVNVLLLGESGVGKDIIAQSIHNAGERQNKPFIAVNCAAFPKDLISSELFGYDEGAFTGSKKGGNMGKFELANHGTIFLDEIGDMPLDLQALLLRVIEQKSFMKIGSSISTNIDVRIIAATNKNLKEKIQKGEFREDLYYRLGIIKINIPPLRKRKDDILLLSEVFINKICRRIHKPFVVLSPQVKEFFLEYHWPGNVRELQNLLEGVIQISDNKIISYEEIANSFMDEPLIEVPIISNNTTESNKIKSFVPNSKEQIINALEVNKYNKTNTANYLGISRKTLYRRLKEYNLL